MRSHYVLPSMKLHSRLAWPFRKQSLCDLEWGYSPPPWATPTPPTGHALSILYHTNSETALQLLECSNREELTQAPILSDSRVSSAACPQEATATGERQVPFLASPSANPSCSLHADYHRRTDRAGSHNSVFFHTVKRFLPHSLTHVSLHEQSYV